MGPAGGSQGSPQYALQYSASPFGFAVTRSDGSTPVPLFNTAGNRLIFKADLLVHAPDAVSVVTVSHKLEQCEPDAI